MMMASTPPLPCVTMRTRTVAAHPARTPISPAALWLSPGNGTTNCRLNSRPTFSADLYVFDHNLGLFCKPKTSGGHIRTHSRAKGCFASTIFPASSDDKPSSVPSETSDLKLNLPRRRLQVSFTCDACGVRSQRLINPDAYARGTVFIQCAGCEVYHKLVDNLALIEEYDFREGNEEEEA